MNSRATVWRAIAATFARRETTIPVALPEGLTQAFADNPAKQRQWTDFCANAAVEAGTLSAVVAHLAAFLMPHAAAARAIAGK